MQIVDFTIELIIADNFSLNNTPQYLDQRVNYNFFILNLNYEDANTSIFQSSLQVQCSP